MRALKVSDAEMAAMAREQGLETLRPELGTQPRVYYRNLHRYTRLFAGGTVLAARDGVIDCLGGARAELIQDGQVIAATDTDAFGDFKFDRLAPQSGAYEIRVTHAAWRTVSVPFELHQLSVVLQDIVLDSLQTDASESKPPPCPTPGPCPPV